MSNHSIKWSMYISRMSLVSDFLSSYLISFQHSYHLARLTLQSSVGKVISPKLQHHMDFAHTRQESREDLQLLLQRELILVVLDHGPLKQKGNLCEVHWKTKRLHTCQTEWSCKSCSKQHQILRNAHKHNKIRIETHITSWRCHIIFHYEVSVQLRNTSLLVGVLAPMERMEDNIWTCSPQTAVFGVSETCSVPLMRAGNSAASLKEINCRRISGPL